MSSESVSCVSRVSVALLELPDDVLLVALQFLPVDDLLACRLVCRRLGGLALHRDVWRHRALSASEPSARVALLLAPCLKEVAVAGKRDPLMLLVATKCAIKRLSIIGDRNLDLVALVVCRQEVLGGLRHLDLYLPCSSENAENADALMLTVAASSTLESLYLYRSVLSTPAKTCPLPPLPYGPPGSCLKHFRCKITSDSQSQSYVEAILAGHATTLESVDINVCGCDQVTYTSQLLANMPNLRKLACSWRCGLQAVPACKSLTDLVLYENTGAQAFWEDPLAVDGAAELFRRTTHLRSLSVELGYYVNHNREAGVTRRLMDALAVPGRSLEALRLNCEPLRLVPHLCHALPALTHLSVLQVGDDYTYQLNRVVDKLLQAISVSAPALQLLELVNRWEDSDVRVKDCPHAWLHHSDILKTTFKANPSLHIVMDTFAYLGHMGSYGTCLDKDCDVCPLDCHQEIFEGGFIGLHSHNIEQCPAPAPKHYPVGWSERMEPDVWFKIQ